MINREELAICKRRGHEPGAGVHLGWVHCKWCGVWLREVRTMEEREEEPPEDEKKPVSAITGQLIQTDHYGTQTFPRKTRRPENPEAA